MRLIGIGTPETKRPATPIECGGREASANMLRLSFAAPKDSDGDGLLDREGGQGRHVALASLLSDLSARATYDDPSRMAKFSEADRNLKERKRGRRRRPSGR